MLHPDGKDGQMRMKAVTVALLSLIEERSGHTSAQLEAKFGLGLRDADDMETGQEWRRYAHSPSNNRKNNQAFSIGRLFDIAGTALDLGYVTREDLWRLKIVELESASAVQTRIANERLANQIFKKGRTLLLGEKMPLPPAGSKGGRPRAACNAGEAAESFIAWTNKIESLGCFVFEDRSNVAELDDWLIDILDLRAEPRDLADEDYALLPSWARPLDPREPTYEAIDRLRIRFSFGWRHRPWSPEYSEPYKERFESAEAASTEEEMDIETLFQKLVEVAEGIANAQGRPLQERPNRRSLSEEK